MAKDKRYSHYMGRPFAHFDDHGYTPDSFGQTPTSGAGPFYRSSVMYTAIIDALVYIPLSFPLILSLSLFSIFLLSGC